MTHGSLVRLSISTAVAAAVAGGFGASVQHGQSITLPVVQEVGTPRFAVDESATPLRTSRTIPYWSSTFTDPTNGVTYPYTMVGTSPFAASLSSTTVRTVIVPLDFSFAAAGGYTLQGSSKVDETIASPMFQTAYFPLSKDTTQYADAIMRS